MNSIWEARYVVIDVETTGSDPSFHNLIDISCVIVENGVIQGEFSTLVRSKQYIPRYISSMTGITHEMLVDAPKISDIISEVNSIISHPNTIFVAHNVDFDYSFVRSAFERCGYQFPLLPKLCTLKLARRLVGAISKKNLGALAEFFNIPLVNRHRANADAKATAMLLIELLQIAEEEHNIETIDELLVFQNKKLYSYAIKQKINPNLNLDITTLPEFPGVYYFFDQSNRPLYVGKAKSLRRRIQSYFTNFTTSKKTMRLIQNSYSFKYVQTNTELSAILLEAKEIKRLQPIMNIRNRFYHHFPFICITKDGILPILHVTYLLNDEDGEYYGPFPNAFIANTIINEVFKVFNIKKCISDEDLSDPSSRCFYYKVAECFAPCVAQDGNPEIEKLIKSIKNFIDSSANILIEKFNQKMYNLAEGHNFEEAAFVRNLIIELKKEVYPNEKGFLPLSKRNFIAINRNKNLSSIDNYEIVIIRNGRFVWDYSFSYHLPLELIRERIHLYFFNGSKDLMLSKSEDIEEIRLIKNWIYSRHNTLKLISIEGKDENSIEKELLHFIQ